MYYATNFYLTSGDSSAKALPKDAWTEGVVEVVGGGGGGRTGVGGVECGPDDELLIVLDAARFLPDNVSVSLARLSLLHLDGSPVKLTSTSARDAFGVPNATTQGVANLEASLHSPTYELSCSFRVRDCNPSAWVVVRIDALDLQQPPGSSPVCVGLGCLQIFQNMATGRPFTEEEGVHFLADVQDAQDTARKHELDPQEAAKLLPRLAVLQGGWQIPLRSSWPLRALWGPGALGAVVVEKRSGSLELGGNAVGQDPDAGALTSLAAFVGEDVLARARAGKQGKKGKALQEGAGAGGAATDSEHLRLALGLIEGPGDDAHVTTRLETIGPHLVQELPRLPCSSLLLRVLVNPSEDDMMSVLSHAGHLGLLDEIERRQRDLAKREREKPQNLHAPAAHADEEEDLRREEVLMRSAIVRTKPMYSLGLYNSQATVPSGVERAMLPHKLASIRRDLCANDTLRQLLRQLLPVEVGPNFSLSAAASKLLIREGGGAGTEKVINDLKKMAQERGTGEEGASGDGERAAAAGGEEESKGRAVVSGALDLSFFSAYLPGIGFQVAIDGANNLHVVTEKTGELVWPVAVAGVLPNSAYFASDNAGLLTAHTWFVSNLHPASTRKCPRWQEGMKHVYDVPFLGHRVALLVQILGLSRVQVERGTQKVTEISRHELGWAAMPLFLSNHLPYIVDGKFQIPIYSGPVPSSLAGDMERKGCEETLREYQESKRAILMPAASLLVRVVDVQRGATTAALLPAGGHPNPVPPSDPGLAADVSPLFIHTWPSLSPHVPPAGTGRVRAPGVRGKGESVERISGKETAAYLRLASSGFLSGDPLISTLVQKIKRADKGKGGGGDKGSVAGTVLGSVMEGAGGKGAGAKGGLSVSEFQLQLRCAGIGPPHHTHALSSRCSRTKFCAFSVGLSVSIPPARACSPNARSPNAHLHTDIVLRSVPLARNGAAPFAPSLLHLRTPTM
jgi:hypothetical protein